MDEPETYPRIVAELPPPNDQRLDHQLVGIGKFLEDKQLVIPQYQRTFAWEQDNIVEFWEDIAGAIGECEPDYFLGNIVTAPGQEDQELQVIDGQQRLITATILFSVVRDKLEMLGDQGREEATKFIGARNNVSGDWRYWLTLQKDIDKFFRDVVIAEPGKRDEKLSAATESQERLVNARKELKKRVDGLVDNQEGEEADAKALNIFLNFLAKNVRILWINSDDTANAYIIFETLNDRGADLTTSDLLKNFLFLRAAAKSENNLNDVVKEWDDAMNNLQAPESSRTTFLKHLWSSFYGKTREKNLYKEMKAQITGAEEASEFAKKLSKGAEIYSAAENSGHEYWAKMSTPWKSSCTESLDALLDLGAEQMRPLLLAILEKWEGEDAEISKALKVLVDWHFRIMVAGTAGSGGIEELYCDLAVRVRGEQEPRINDAEELLTDSEALGKIPSDTAFRDAFELYRVPIARSKIARYILGRIEDSEGSDEFKVNRNTAEVNLEHIYPKKPAKDKWKRFKEDDRKDNLTRVGNLTLLKSGDNGGVSNKAYSEKKVTYSKSSLSLTSEIPEKYPEWTPRAVATRQKELAKKAVELWRKKHG